MKTQFKSKTKPERKSYIFRCTRVDGQEKKGEGERKNPPKQRNREWNEIENKRIYQEPECRDVMTVTAVMVMVMMMIAKKFIRWLPRKAALRTLKCILMPMMRKTKPNRRRTNAPSVFHHHHRHHHLVHAFGMS